MPPEHVAGFLLASYHRPLARHPLLLYTLDFVAHPAAFITTLRHNTGTLLACHTDIRKFDSLKRSHKEHCWG
eukprot:GDKH01014957.1.p2 GENE.GDKH01014957.1~~GDKH01014957.1.p2  ORF type:complete len:72 (+),score=1.09 GDKH01014957.1:134-349(+)